MLARKNIRSSIGLLKTTRSKAQGTEKRLSSTQPRRAPAPPLLLTRGSSLGLLRVGLAFAVGVAVGGGYLDFLDEQLFARGRIEYSDGNKFGDPVSRYGTKKAMEQVSDALFSKLLQS